MGGIDRIDGIFAGLNKIIEGGVTGVNLKPSFPKQSCSILQKSRQSCLFNLKPHNIRRRVYSLTERLCSPEIKCLPSGEKAIA